MKKIFLIIVILSFAGCGTISEKTSKIKPNIGECPPESERTLSDILCKEAK